MDRQEVRKWIVDHAGERFARIGLHADEVTDDLDLLHTGVLDSLAFVDLFAALIEATGKDLDLESSLAKSGSTTLGGLVKLFT